MDALFSIPNTECHSIYCGLAYSSLATRLFILHNIGSIKSDILHLSIVYSSALDTTSSVYFLSNNLRDKSLLVLGNF